MLSFIRELIEFSHLGDGSKTQLKIHTHILARPGTVRSLYRKRVARVSKTCTAVRVSKVSKTFVPRFGCAESESVSVSQVDNKWHEECSSKVKSSVMGDEIKAAVNASVLNHPSFKAPSQDCHPDLEDVCDNNGGIFALFERNLDPCQALTPQNSSSPGMAAGATVAVILALLGKQLCSLQIIHQSRLDCQTYCLIPPF